MMSFRPGKKNIGRTNGRDHYSIVWCGIVRQPARYARKMRRRHTLLAFIALLVGCRRAYLLFPDRQPILLFWSMTPNLISQSLFLVSIAQGDYDVLSCLTIRLTQPCLQLIIIIQICDSSDCYRWMQQYYISTALSCCTAAANQDCATL